MADEWKNEDSQQAESAQRQNSPPTGQQGQQGKQGEQSDFAQDGQQSQADRQETGQQGFSDQDTMGNQGGFSGGAVETEQSGATSESGYGTTLDEQLEQADSDTMTKQDEASSEDASFGQSAADGSAFIGSQSAGPDDYLQEQEPQSDFAGRDALTQENDDGMGEAGR